MKYLKLNEIKQHLNIDEYFIADDSYVTSLGDVAEAVVEKHIDNSLDMLCDSEGVLPAPLRHAMLLLIGNFYANRESVTMLNAKELPLSYNYLLDLFKNYNPQH